MQAQIDFVQNQLDAALHGGSEEETVELTDEELDMVCGGGFSEWWNRNKETVGVILAVVGGAVAIATGLAGLAGVIGLFATFGGVVLGMGSAGVGLMFVGEANRKTL